MASIRVRSGPKMLFGSIFVTANLVAQTLAAEGWQPTTSQRPVQPVYTAAFDAAFNQDPQQYGNCPPGYGGYSTTPQVPNIAPQSPYSSTPAPESQGPADMNAPPSLESQFAAETSEFAAVSPNGYIDNAVPFTNLRLRYDAAFDQPFPDRAEYFYAKCGCLGGDALGVPLPETNVNYQEASAYLEYAIANEFSVFIEAPYRALDPDVNENTSGLGDINLGFKSVLHQYGAEFLTFQTRVYTSSGNARDGLGTGHVSVEPGLLYSRQFGNDSWLFAELRDWIPIGGADDFEGNVLRYGLGYGHVLFETCDHSKRIIPVVEGVGWSVLSGKKSNDVGVFDAAGETIVNLKIGARLSFGGSGGAYLTSEGFDETSSLYVGYGRALTGDWWYRDILRIEYRVLF